jgi:hypothetical protein
MSPQLSTPDLSRLAFRQDKFDDLCPVLTQALRDSIRRPDNAIRMVTAVEIGRCPVEALSDPLITEFGREIGHPRIRQFVGQLVRQVMEYLGYEVERKGVSITRYGVFSSGIRYRDPSQSADKPARITSEQRKAWLQRQEGDAFCRWLDAQVIRPDGNIDVDRLFELAEKWGVEYPARAILNAAGKPKFAADQLRLAFGVLLRQCVPASEYEAEEAEITDEEGERQRQFDIENFGMPLPDTAAEAQAFCEAHRGRRPK